MADAYCDTDPMPFGKYKGVRLGDVPAGYLLWLYNQGPNANLRLENYLKRSLAALQQESPDVIVSRR